MGANFGYTYRKSYNIKYIIFLLAFSVFLYILFCASLTFAAVDVTLAWDPSSGAEGYRLFYREDGQNYDYTLPDWQGTTTTCIIPGLDESTTYHFVVRAFNDYGESGNSNEEHLYPAGTNEAPTASFTASPTSGNAPLTVTFNGSSSNDPDGSVVSYSWNFGDSSTGSGVTASHTYNNSGNYTVTLTVTDDDGATDNVTTLIQVATTPIPNQAPTASFTASPTSGNAPLTVTFNGSSSNDPDGSVVSYSWNFGDSSTGSGVTASHTYNNSGNYTVTLTVTDDDGATDNVTTLIQVATTPIPNQAPTASFTASPTSGNAPLTVTFNGSSSNDPDGSVVSYSWNFGDSSTGSGVTASHTYNNSGNYTVTLTVTDDDGATDNVTTLIQVAEPPASNLPPNQPVIASPYDGEVETDLLLTVQTEPFSDPNGDTHKETQWQIVKAADASVVLEIVSNQHLTEIPVPHAVLDRNTTYNVSVQFVDAYSEPSPWSDPVEFTTHNGVVDFDSDGIPDDNEVDDTVDLNEDGTADNDQPDVIKSAHSAVAGKKPLGVNKASASIKSIELLEPIHPSEILDKKNKPKNFLFGLAAYRLRLNQVGDTVNVTVYYSEDISGANSFYLYDTVNGWRDYTQYVTFNPDGKSVTVELKDGGQGDSDGVANGVIVDPSGVVESVAADSGAGGGCFIATAASGTYIEPHVKLHTASYIEEHDWLQPIVRVLLTPLAGVSYILVRSSLATLILLGFMLIISVLSIYALIYRRKKYQV